MSYSKKDIRLKFQQVITGFETSTQAMNAGYTTETVELSCPASKVTVQSTGDLAFDWAISANGETFSTVDSGVTAGTLKSYTTHLVATVKITRVSGTGRVAILGVS